MRIKLLGVLAAATAMTAMSANSYAAKDYFKDMSPEELFTTVCSSCHSLALPKSQNLDRGNWEWVIEDMKEFGCSKIIGDEYKAKIVDYLVEHYGPID
jgi:mono/diheme cytochrome c family protein